MFYAVNNISSETSDVSPVDIKPFDIFSSKDIFSHFEGKFHFDSSGESKLCSLPGFEKFYKFSKYHKLINNIISAEMLNNSDIEDGKLHNDISYGYRGYSVSLEETDMNDIKSGKAFLRANKQKGIIYTVKRAGSRYIFRLFAIGSPENMNLILYSNWCVKKVPSMSLFDNIKEKTSNINDVRKIDPNFILFKTGENSAHSEHTFADKKGTIIHIEYKKGEDGIFYVDKVERFIDGFNVLPYLLPIDRQLIDPNYVPSEVSPTCTIL